MNLYFLHSMIADQDDTAGKTIAVVHDAQFGPLFAASPVMLDALKSVLDQVKSTSAYIDALAGEDPALLASVQAAAAAIDLARPQ